jgi:hypothetical protein
MLDCDLLKPYNIFNSCATIHTKMIRRYLETHYEPIPTLITYCFRVAQKDDFANNPTDYQCNKEKFRHYPKSEYYIVFGYSSASAYKSKKSADTILSCKKSPICKSLEEKGMRTSLSTSGESYWVRPI